MKYYRHEPNATLANTESFELKVKIPGKNPGDGSTKDVEIAITLKYLNNFWRSFEMPLINCEISLNLKWSSTCYYRFNKCRKICNN